MTDQIPAEAVEAAVNAMNKSLGEADGAGSDLRHFEVVDEVWSEVNGAIDVPQLASGALAAALPFLRPEPSVTHRPGDEVDGTVYCSCGDGDYGSEGHRPEPSEDERAEPTDEDLWDFADDVLNAWGIEDENPPSLTEQFRDLYVGRFTRHPTPSREQVAGVISDFLAPILGQSPGGPSQMDYDLADAVLALFEGADRG